MRRLMGFAIILTSALWLVIMLLFARRPGVDLQLAAMGVTLLFLGAGVVSLGLAFAGRRRPLGRRVLPFASVLVAIVLFLLLAGVVRDRYVARVLPTYKKIVGEIQAGRIAVPSSLSRVSVDGVEPRTIILAERDENSVTTVEFIYGLGFPVRHTGLLYRSSGSVEGSLYSSRWRCAPAEENWFHISD